MFQITKLNLSDIIYPIECTYIRIEDILWLRQILQAVKVWAIWWGKEPCSFVCFSRVGCNFILLTLYFLRTVFDCYHWISLQSYRSQVVEGEFLFSQDVPCMFWKIHSDHPGIYSGRYGADLLRNLPLTLACSWTIWEPERHAHIFKESKRSNCKDSLVFVLLGYVDIVVSGICIKCCEVQFSIYVNQNLFQSG